MSIEKQNQHNLIHGSSCRQISFQRQYSGKVVPVFRHSKNTPWIPCAQSQIAAPKDVDGGTLGYAKWQAMFKAGYEVIKT